MPNAPRARAPRATALAALLFTFPVLMTTTLLAAAPALAQQPSIALPKGVTAGPSLEGVSEYRLDNGLKVVLLPDPSQDTITTNIVYLVGSRNEGYGEAGMAHLLEHMLFKGTAKIPNQKAELISRGARFNGTTSFDRTNYFQTFPAQGDNLAWSIALEADRMVNSKVLKSDLDTEMTVVRNEFEAGENSPYSVLRERLSATAYLWHNYGRSVIGNRADIENVPIERLQAFYRHYYQPDNAVLVIAGRFEPADALRHVAEHFGPIPRPARKLQETYTAEPTQDGERNVVLRRAGNVQVAAVMYHIPSGTHPDYMAIEFLTQIMSNVPAGRLHKALVDTGRAANIWGFERQQREPGVAYFGATAAQGQTAETVRDLLLDAVENLDRDPVRDEEIERARTTLQSEVEKVTTNTRQLAITLSEFIAIGDWRLLYWYRDQLPKITKDDVHRVARAYLKRDNRTVGLFVPTDKPDRAVITAASAPEKLLEGFKGRGAIAQGEVFDAAPANIEQRLVRRTLPGGLQLTLLPKKTRGETVIANLALRWGDETTKADRNLACTLAGQMLSRGTAQRSRAQIRDELSKLRANVRVSLEDASIDTVRANLVPALAVVADMLRRPSFPAAEFEQLRTQIRTSIDSQRTDPGALAALHIQRHLNPYPEKHWHYTPTLDERLRRLDALTLEDLRACHSELVGASDAELSVVGDFDPDEVTRAVESMLGDWKSPRPYRRVGWRMFEVPVDDRTIDTPDKANATYRAGVNIELADTDADFPAMVLGNYLLGGSSDSRLYRRIREKEGLSYSVYSWLSASSHESVAEFGVTAIHAPQNRERLEAYVREEIERALKDGFTQAELETARKGLLQARHVARNQDATLAARLTNYAHLKRTFAWDIAFEQRIAALTAEEVRAALAKYIRPEKLSVVRAGDFTKAVAAK